MSDAFDPYYIWLGIPPEEQPPHHYRLLGVTLFEENSEVIEAAANRQMAYIQEISAGDDHIDQAQKIMGQLSKARVCLLNSEKKAAYDAELRASFDTLDQASESTDASSPSAPTIATPNSPGGDGPLMPPQFGKTAGQEAPVTGVSQDGKTAKRSTRPASGKRETKVPVRPGFLAGIILLIVGAVISWLLLGTPEDGSKVTQNGEPTQAEQDIQRLEKKVQELKATQESERKAKEESERKAKEESERKAKEESERKAKEESERKAKEESERKAKEDADRKAKEESERKAEKKDAAAKRLKEDANKYIKSKGFIFIAENERWWPEASYPSYKKVEELADSLKQGNLYETNLKEFWSQVRDLLDKQKQIQSALDAANEPAFITRLEILGQKPGEIPEISWLKGTATSFLQGEGLKETGKNVWRLEEEAQLKQAKDAESNPSEEMLKKFNPTQQQLLRRVLNQYQIMTKAEWDKLLKAGQQFAGQPGKVGFATHGKNEFGQVGWTRFNFLSWHHPDVDVSAFGWEKKSPEEYYKHALKFCLHKLQETPDWQKASRKRSKANTLQKKISKKYKKLQRSIGVEVALEIVDGKLPPTATNK